MLIVRSIMRRGVHGIMLLMCDTIHAGAVLLPLGFSLNDALSTHAVFFRKKEESGRWLQAPGRPSHHLVKRMRCGARASGYGSGSRSNTNYQFLFALNGANFAVRREYFFVDFHVSFFGLIFHHFWTDTPTHTKTTPRALLLFAKPTKDFTQQPKDKTKDWNVLFGTGLATTARIGRIGRRLS
jgi:hypothetical protein